MTPTLPTDRPAIPFTAPSGAVYLLPSTNAHLIYRAGEIEEISEATMLACFPRVTHGTADTGISRNPVTELLEVRVDGVLKLLSDSIWECRRKGFHFEAVSAPLIAAIAVSDADDEATAPGLSAHEPIETEVVTVDVEPKPRKKREARNDWEAARFGFWAAAYEFGVMARGKLETDVQRKARLACLSAWCNIERVNSLNDLTPDQIRSATAAIRRGEILAGWNVRELAA